jgi:hypothetical protein
VTLFDEVELRSRRSVHRALDAHPLPP